MAVSIGVRAHDFGLMKAEALARRVAEHGLSCVQLAPAKALLGVSTAPGSITREQAGAIRAAFASEGVRIAVLGCYVNLVHPDVGERECLIERFIEYVHLARDFGCGIVATETASLNADWSWHPGNASEEAFRLALSSIRALVREAEFQDIVVAIEGVSSHVMSTPQRLRAMLDIIASPHLRILFDPVNLLTAENARDHRRIIDESFRLLGSDMVAIHAKDYVVDNGVLRSVTAGRGDLDYEFLMHRIAEHTPGLDVILEDTTPDTIGRSIDHVRGFGTVGSERD